MRRQPKLAVLAGTMALGVCPKKLLKQQAGG
jgi:hypothetical protein